MNRFEDMLKFLRKQRGMSQLELSEVLGVGKSTISMYENGQRKPSFEVLEEIADFFNVDMDYLLGKSTCKNRYQEKEVSLAPNLLPAPNFVRKPRLGRVACGQPILAEEHIEDYDLVPSDIKCDFTLVCKGDSMINARIFDGDIVCVRQQEEVENGEIAVVMVDEDEATLKRFYRYDDHIELRAENPSFRDKAFWDEDMARVRVLGRATHCIAPIK